MSTSPTDKKRGLSAANAAVVSTNSGNHPVFRVPLPPEPRVLRSTSRGLTHGKANTNSSSSDVGTSCTKKSELSNSSGPSSSDMFKVPFPVNRNRNTKEAKSKINKVASTNLNKPLRDSKKTVQSSSANRKNDVSSSKKVNEKLIIKPASTSKASGSSKNQELNKVAHPTLPVNSSIFEKTAAKNQTNTFKARLSSKKTSSQGKPQIKKVKKAGESEKMKLPSSKHRRQIRQKLSEYAAIWKSTSHEKDAAEGLLLLLFQDFPPTAVINMTEKVSIDHQSRERYNAKLQDLMRQRANGAVIDPNRFKLNTSKDVQATLAGSSKNAEIIVNATTAVPQDQESPDCLLMEFDELSIVEIEIETSIDDSTAGSPSSGTFGFSDSQALEDSQQKLGEFEIEKIGGTICDLNIVENTAASPSAVLSPAPVQPTQPPVSEKITVSPPLQDVGNRIVLDAPLTGAPPPLSYGPQSFGGKLLNLLQTLKHNSKLEQSSSQSATQQVSKNTLVARNNIQDCSKSDKNVQKRNYGGLKAIKQQQKQTSFTSSSRSILNSSRQNWDSYHEPNTTYNIPKDTEAEKSVREMLASKSSNEYLVDIIQTQIDKSLKEASKETDAEKSVREMLASKTSNEYLVDIIQTQIDKSLNEASSSKNIAAPWSTKARILKVKPNPQQIVDDDDEIIVVD